MVTALEEYTLQLHEHLEGIRATVDVLYNAIRDGSAIKGSKLEKTILQTKQTLFDPLDEEEIISDFYVSDSKEFTKNEFPMTYAAIAFELARYHKFRVGENLGAVITLAEPAVTQIISDYLPQMYSDPNDFLLEYKTFKNWHETSSEPLQRNAFTFWMDAMVHYCIVSAIYHQIFEQETTDLKELKRIGLGFVELRREELRIEQELK
ncbi:hypothetical protein COY27_01760 [Candidatus Woesearchaeota archaeon CG_4_10_14_0_2_um_filter_33_13]|nr:MAG: hypothetical protein COY27_01760 [Candidatus Woesearchaeota archaeon CG_4_10_14_0_2_um_filter_33_13]